MHRKYSTINSNFDDWLQSLCSTGTNVFCCSCCSYFKTNQSNDNAIWYSIKTKKSTVLIQPVVKEEHRKKNGKKMRVHIITKSRWLDTIRRWFLFPCAQLSFAISHSRKILDGREQQRAEKSKREQKSAEESRREKQVAKWFCFSKRNNDDFDWN